MIRQVAVLGATGAIGSGALDVIRSQPHRYRARVLAAHRDVDALAKLCSIHRPDLAVIADASLEAALARRLVSAGVLCDIAGGPEALVQAAASASCDTAVIEIAGFAGIEVALAAARTGKRLLLGNQETAVMAGPLLHQALTKGGGVLIPLAPELHAAFLTLAHVQPGRIPQRLLLAGTGGPFYGQRRSQLMAVIPEQLDAVTSGGVRAALDIACLMRHGLQLIAAHSVLHAAPSRIEAAIQPQGQVHALLEYADGSPEAQRGDSDRQATLAQALAWPASLAAKEAPQHTPAEPPEIEPPDTASFRCLALAYQALRAGGDASTILNAAYDVAAEAFLAGALPFLSIADLVEQVLMELPPMPVVDIQTLSERERAAQGAARRVLRNAC